METGRVLPWLVDGARCYNHFIERPHLPVDVPVPYALCTRVHVQYGQEAEERTGQREIFVSFASAEASPLQQYPSFVYNGWHQQQFLQKKTRRNKVRYINTSFAANIDKPPQQDTAAVKQTPKKGYCG